MCLTLIQVQLTRYVWGGPSSIDKIYLMCVPPSGNKICLNWSKFNWQDASDISWLGMLSPWRSMPWQRFKLIRIQTLSRVSSVPFETFSPQQFSFFVTVAKSIATHLVALKNCSQITPSACATGRPCVCFLPFPSLFDWRSREHTFIMKVRAPPHRYLHLIFYLCLSFLLFLYQF